MFYRGPRGGRAAGRSKVTGHLFNFLSSDVRPLDLVVFALNVSRVRFLRFSHQSSKTFGFHGCFDLQSAFGPFLGLVDRLQYQISYKTDFHPRAMPLRETCLFDLPIVSSKSPPSRAPVAAVWTLLTVRFHAGTRKSRAGRPWPETACFRVRAPGCGFEPRRGAFFSDFFSTFSKRVRSI